ncbi:MAG: hypothetical protein NTW17_02810 [Candidatus Pacearchaeota archaeon]|nr:hypothetical protein [Candidatus Pacearchaeota archaeon]
MDFGQIMLLVGILGIIDSIIAMSFPKFTSKIYHKLRFREFGTTEKSVKKIAVTEFIISLVLCLIGMNI